MSLNKLRPAASAENFADKEASKLQEKKASHVLAKQINVEEICNPSTEAS